MTTSTDILTQTTNSTSTNPPITTSILSTFPPLETTSITHTPTTDSTPSPSTIPPTTYSIPSTSPPLETTSITHTPTTNSTTSITPPTTNSTLGTSPPIETTSITHTSTTNSTTSITPPTTNSTLGTSPLIETTSITHTPTTTPPTTTPATQPPLVCLNGLLQDGVCICPDEWTGVTCSVANLCNEATVEGFEFPQTVIGWSAYSSQTCENTTNNANISKASTRCLYNNGRPEFDRIQKIECQITLENIQVNVTGSLDAVETEQLASSTQILTSRPEWLTASNITSAAQIVNTILSDSVNITEGTAVAAVTTISQLLTADPKKFPNESNAFGGLTQNLETFSANPNNNFSLVVQPRLVVQAIQVPTAQTAGIQFSALSGTSNNFTTSRIQLKTNMSEISDTEIPSDVQIFIRLPDQLHKNSNISVGFVLYENDLLFKSKAFKTSLNTRRMVISGTLGNVKAEHVTLRFIPMNVSKKSLHDFACVFWDYSLNDWSTVGCSKANLLTGSLQCTCNHTTNFAVLMSFREDHKYAESLTVFSIVGCTLSILGLILTVIFQIITRKSRKSAPTILLVNICVCMTMFYFLFLFGIEKPNKGNSTVSEKNVMLLSDHHQDSDKGACTALTALMQYFLLATFTSNTLYAVHIFILIRKTLSGPPSGVLLVSLVTGWGLPAVVVAISLGVAYRVDNPLGYRREEFCWLQALNQDGKFDFGKPMFWGFLLPVAVMLLLNTAVLIYFGFATCKKDPLLNSTKNTSMRKRFLSSFSLGVLLGLTWVLGYLVLSTEGTTNYIFSILFCVCNTTQGLQIFILFTVRTAYFRKTFFSAATSVSPPETHSTDGNTFCGDPENPRLVHRSPQVVQMQTSLQELSHRAIQI
ncbi:adhesion G-protein coupled receptor G7-like [Alosa pseudoharengus]|uniref:adhesion G-protein coupled receptor G7-like n=1 Tax=Alosa pseudoharengus TaxID=34774 RepID=UPI003F8B6888